jgi:hypothetical protein
MKLQRLGNWIPLGAIALLLGLGQLWKSISQVPATPAAASHQ